MVAKQWSLDDARDHLNEVLDRAAIDGPQTIVDLNGNMYEVRPTNNVSNPANTDELPLSERLRRHLPPGEPIDADMLRDHSESRRLVEIENWIREIDEESNDHRQHKQSDR